MIQCPECGGTNILVKECGTCVNNDHDCPECEGIYVEGDVQECADCGLKDAPNVFDVEEGEVK